MIKQVQIDIDNLFLATVFVNDAAASLPDNLFVKRISELTAGDTESVKVLLDIGVICADLDADTILDFLDVDHLECTVEYSVKLIARVKRTDDKLSFETTNTIVDTYKIDSQVGDVDYELAYDIFEADAETGLTEVMTAAEAYVNNLEGKLRGETYEP